MKKITLNTETIKVPREDSYSIEDMERMFGKRVRKAINIELNKNGRIYKAIITKKMAKIIKPWKFWNADIRKAYKNYVGMLLVPWVIVNEPFVVEYNPTAEEYLKKPIDLSKYSVINRE